MSALLHLQIKFVVVKKPRGYDAEVAVKETTALWHLPSFQIMFQHIETTEVLPVMTFITFDWSVVFMVETSPPDHLQIYHLDVSPPNMAVMLSVFVQVNCKVPDLLVRS